ncbi:MAG TPA: methylated-DNA--[protein]-cysteine S-methyltransferase [Verrucomicrobiae bacterium]|nr:methylated-DNA--[protein]-cysteine S-methyltransferase [Verrucomicrobiae bacterium]
MKTIEAKSLSEAEMERAWRARDAGYDGLFFFGVKTTGIVCRPSCPSRPQRRHLEFFHKLGEAIGAGYRPCKRCRPELAGGTPPEWVAKLMDRAASAEAPVRANDLQELGVTAERARRWFQGHYGMTFAAWCRGIRLAGAFTQIRRGEPLDDVILGNGFESHSGFRTAFARTFGRPPGRARNGDCLRAALLDTPLGPMLAAASSTALCQLEFADRRGLERSYAEMRKRFGLPVVPGENEIIKTLRAELREWFEGKLRKFSVPVNICGTPFQERVWKELQRIPYGRTASYLEIARRVGKPAAVRAVARANGTNRLYLLVPCHRVIAKDGELSGYGGGVWRKRALLELERTGKLPG